MEQLKKSDRKTRLILLGLRLLAVVLAAFFLIKVLNSATLYRSLNLIVGVGVFQWLAGIAFSVGILVTLSVMFICTFQAVSLRLRLLEAFQYSALNAFYNLVLPFKAGLAIRGYYMSRIHAVSWRSYTFLVIAAQALQALILLFLGVVAGILLGYDMSTPFTSPQVVFYAIAFTLIGLLLGVLYERKHKMKEKLLGGLRTWQNKHRALGVFLISMLLMHILTAMRLYWAFSLSGVSLTFQEIFAIYGVLALGLLLNLTPGNLGIKEVGIVALAGMMGIDESIAFSAAILDRIAATVVVIGTGMWASQSLKFQRNTGAV